MQGVHSFGLLKHPTKELATRVTTITNSKKGTPVGVDILDKFAWSGLIYLVGAYLTIGAAD